MLLFFRPAGLLANCFCSVIVIYSILFLFYISPLNFKNRIFLYKAETNHENHQRGYVPGPLQHSSK